MDFRSWGPATVLLVVLAMIVVAVGGVIAIVNPDTLSFAQYLNDLKTFALAVAGLGLARGVHLGLKANAPTLLEPIAASIGHVDPEDADELPHIPVHPGNVPADEGDKGAA